jgi:hypothetical protein
MPRYLVERTFAKGFHVGTESADACVAVVEHNAEERVTWLHSYVSEDRRRMFCLYQAPSPEAIRASALLNELPVDRITRVDVLDPYSYR